MFFIFVNDFFNTMRSELHSERTIETYRQSLNAFRFYLSEKYGKGVDQITIDFVTEQMIRDFLVSVADSNSVGTRNVRLSGIKAYLKYVATRDMEVVPLQIAVSTIKAKKVYPKKHNWLTREEVDLLLAQQNKQKSGFVTDLSCWFYSQQECGLPRCGRPSSRTSSRMKSTHISG